jgi:hypothetical protein
MTVSRSSKKHYLWRRCTILLLFIITDKTRTREEGRGEGVDATLLSYTHGYINLVEVVVVRICQDRKGRTVSLGKQIGSVVPLKDSFPIKIKKIGTVPPASSAPFGTYQARLFQCSFLFQHE